MSRLKSTLALDLTPEFFLKMIVGDYETNSKVVAIERGGREVLGSLELDEDGTAEIHVGSMEHGTPMYGLRHDYRQARAALDFFEEYETMLNHTRDLTPQMVEAAKMPVPDFPPYEPLVVNSAGEERRFEAPLIREDYKVIMSVMNLVAPDPKWRQGDLIMQGWTHHDNRLRRPDSPQFQGRAERGAPNSVFLRFNPLTPAGASLVSEFVQEGDVLRGKYVIRGTARDFEYSLHGEGYVVSPDEWASRLGAKSAELLAYDLVADYDFWRFPVRIRTEMRDGKIKISDRLLPAKYRFVSCDLTRPCYSQRTIDYEHPPAEGYVMHAGSSLLHRVDVRRGQFVEGQYVRVVPCEVGKKGFELFPLEVMDEDGVFAPAGIYVTNQDQEVYTGEYKALFRHKEYWRVGTPFKVTYATGRKNALIHKINGISILTFRAHQVQAERMGYYNKDRFGPGIGEVPLCGIYTNPQSSSIYVESDIIAMPGENQVGYTTHFLHPDVYMNGEGCVALRGLNLFDYVVAMKPVGRRIALNDMVQMSTSGYASLDFTVESACVGTIATVQEDQLLEVRYRQYLEELDDFLADD